MDSFYRSAITNDHKSSGLEQRKFILSQWRKVWNQGVSRATLFPKALEAFLVSSSFWHLPAFLGVIASCIIPVSASIITWRSQVCVCVSVPSHGLLINTSVFDLGPTLIQCNVILTHDICQDSLSKWSHVWGSGWTWILRVHYSTQCSLPCGLQIFISISHAKYIHPVNNIHKSLNLFQHQV